MGGNENEFSEINGNYIEFL